MNLPILLRRLIFLLFQDHLITMTQNLNHYEKILSRSHSNYLAQISIEMTEANNQINNVLSKLTALGTVLIPMNLVTGTYFYLLFFLYRNVAYFYLGLWGMNVHVPGQEATVSLFYSNYWKTSNFVFRGRVTRGSFPLSLVLHFLPLLVVIRPTKWFVGDQYLIHFAISLSGYIYLYPRRAVQVVCSHINDWLLFLWFPYTQVESIYINTRITRYRPMLYSSNDDYGKNYMRI